MSGSGSEMFLEHSYPSAYTLPGCVCAAALGLGSRDAEHGHFPLWERFLPLP